MYTAFVMGDGNHVRSGGSLLGDSLLECGIPAEIPLARPPLKLALAQIRFPSVLPIDQSNSPMVAEFQESVRSEYPDYGTETGIALALGPGGVMQQTAPSRHIFKSSDGWEIALTQDFVALSTTSYKAKEEFAQKVHNMADAVKASVRPHRANRLGVRFIDRVEGDALQKIEEYVSPEFLGTYSMLGGKIQSMITEAHLTPLEGKGMLVRWGFLSPGHVLDVGISAHDGPSWMLDSDIYAGDFAGFDPHEIAEKTKELTGRIYAFFRGVFNKKYIRDCGGEV